MAMDTSHAATHDEKAFSVEILSGEEETTVVAEALRDFFEALDSAMDWVEREDPERTQSSSIGIFATSHGVREQVWAYPTEPGMHAAAVAPDFSSFVDVWDSRDHPPSVTVRSVGGETRHVLHAASAIDLDLPPLRAGQFQGLFFRFACEQTIK